MKTQNKTIEKVTSQDYQYGFVTDIEQDTIPPGLNEDVIRLISNKKNEINLPSDVLIHYYKSADVFAMTSLLETFGIVLIEAMAAGLPVVCFDVPGVRDVMNTKCGTACKEGDIESFAHALYRICKSSDRLLLSENCRKYTEQFSWKIISEQYLALYESLI